MLNKVALTLGQVTSQKNLTIIRIAFLLAALLAALLMPELAAAGPGTGAT
ncbi:MAG: hypothetical protein HND51_19355 [Chloroflexi bacterium]|nr:hypothetical protein [Chloroflexota bacterium]